MIYVPGRMEDGVGHPITDFVQLDVLFNGFRWRLNGSEMAETSEK